MPPAKTHRAEGDVTLAATVGYNSYASVQALPGLENQYEGVGPVHQLGGQEADGRIRRRLVLQRLVEARLGRRAELHEPSRVFGRAGHGGCSGCGEDTTGEIPGYRAVADAYSFSYNVFAGVDRCYRLKKVPDLMLYTGVRVGFAYGLNERKYDEPESMGKSTGETWNLRAGITFGARTISSRGRSSWALRSIRSPTPTT